MNPVQWTREVSNTLVNAPTGLLFGTAIEYLFPEAKGVTSSNVLMVTLETLGQLSLDAIVISSYLQSLRSKGNSMTDAQDFGFSLALLASQPNLYAKLGSLSVYLRKFLLDSLVNFSGPTNPTVTAASTANLSGACKGGSCSDGAQQPQLKLTPHDPELNSNKKQSVRNYH